MSGVLQNAWTRSFGRSELNLFSGRAFGFEVVADLFATLIGQDGASDRFEPVIENSGLDKSRDSLQSRVLRVGAAINQMVESGPKQSAGTH